MRTADVVEYYGGVRAAARAIGINHSAVIRWGEVVPYLRACAIEHETRRKLRVDPECYEHSREVA